MTSDKTLNISEASRLTGKSIMTIRAYLEAKPSKLPNAFQTAKGKTKSWNIPLTDLVAAGLLDSVTPEPETKTKASKTEPQDYELRLLVATLEADNRQLRERLARAEAEADELRADYRRMSLGLLQMREIETAQAQGARRRLFARKPKPEPLNPATMPGWSSETL